MDDAELVECLFLASITYLYPSPFRYFPLFGMFARVLSGGDFVQGAYIGLVMALLVGTPYLMLSAVLSAWSKR